MTTIEEKNKKTYTVSWYLTGNIIDEIDAHDHTEEVEGDDTEGNHWTGGAEVSCGEIIEVYESEMSDPLPLDLEN